MLAVKAKRPKLTALSHTHTHAHTHHAHPHLTTYTHTQTSSTCCVLDDLQNTFAHQPAVPPCLPSKPGNYLTHFLRTWRLKYPCLLPRNTHMPQHFPLIMVMCTARHCFRVITVRWNQYNHIRQYDQENMFLNLSIKAKKNKQIRHL